MARRSPVPVLDLVLALAGFVLALAELVIWDEWSTEPRGLQVTGAAVICGSTALRRAAPLAAVGIAASGALLLAVGGDPPQLLAAGLAGWLLAYSIAAELDGRALVAAVSVLGVGLVARDVADPALNGFDIAIDGLFYVGVFAVGRVIRRRQRQLALVSRVAADLERDAVKAERERIARELHDVIAHGMSVMVVQADAARHGLAPDDEESRVALMEIERTGRESLREMRRLLDLLRDDDANAATLAPQAGLKSLDALAQSVRQAGLPVDVEVVGERKPLSPGIDLAAYRIVQEALTNVIRHAGPARAKVEVGYREREIGLRISDTGRGSAVAGAAAGRGLVGMRERARLYGGTFEAGPGPSGFVVTATLPLETPR